MLIFDTFVRNPTSRTASQAYLESISSLAHCMNDRIQPWLFKRSPKARKSVSWSLCVRTRRNYYSKGCICSIITSLLSASIVSIRTHRGENHQYTTLYMSGGEGKTKARRGGGSTYVMILASEKVWHANPCLQRIRIRHLP